MRAAQYIGAKDGFDTADFAPAGSETTYLLGESGGGGGRDFGRDVLGARRGVIRTEEGNDDASKDNRGDEFKRVIGFHFVVRGFKPQDAPPPGCSCTKALNKPGKSCVVRVTKMPMLRHGARDC